MLLTAEMLEAAKSSLGGYSNKQFALIGLSQPIPSGWKKRVIGQEFPEENLRRFVALKDAHYTAEQIEAKKIYNQRYRARRQERLMKEHNDK